MTIVRKQPENTSVRTDVSQPSHYVDGRKYEPRKVIRDWGLNFNLGNAVKYLSRAGRKGDALTDLMKAKQYIEFEIEELQAESGQDPVTERPESTLPTQEELDALIEKYYRQKGVCDAKTTCI